jgi:hypothetical protein
MQRSALVTLLTVLACCAIPAGAQTLFIANHGATATGQELFLAISTLAF